MQVRRRVNALDNLTTGKAVDALLNYETVKLFNNEQLEVDNYDAFLVGYQKAAVATENVSAKLNAGQVQSTLLLRKPEPETCQVASGRLIKPTAYPRSILHTQIAS